VVEFWEARGVKQEQWHVLVLDGLHLGSTTALVEQGLVPLSNIDIVSKTVKMRPKSSTVETGHLYSGLLSDFLTKELPVHSRRYECIAMDFNGGWPGEKRENIRCVQAAFMNNAFMDVSSLAVTCSYRNGPNSPSQYIAQMVDTVRRDIGDIARINGYSVHEKEYIDHNSSFTLFYKVIFPPTAMHKTQCIFQDDNGDYAMDWLIKPL
jgi:hypothetical protein